MLVFICQFLLISKYLFKSNISYNQQSIYDNEVIDEKQSFYKIANKIKLDENYSYGYGFWFKFNLFYQNTHTEIFEEEFIKNKYNSLEYDYGYLIFSEWDALTKQNTVLYFLQPSSPQTYYVILNVILFLQNQQVGFYSQYIQFQVLDGNWIYTYFGFQRNTNLFHWRIYTSETAWLQEFKYQLFEKLVDLEETCNIVGGSGKISYYQSYINLKHILGRFTSVSFTKGIISKDILLQQLQQIIYPNSCTGLVTEILFENQYLDGTYYLGKISHLKGKRFIVRGWNKIIINKNQYHDTNIQMMRITTNKDYTDNGFIGDKLFQLVYIINSDLNKKSGFIVNIQKIPQPFQPLYQGYQNTALDTFYYYDDIMLKRLSNWFYFSYEQGGFQQQLFQIIFTYDFMNAQYDFGNVFYPGISYQLADVDLYILIGGDKFTSRYYYQGYIQKLEILTCLTEDKLYQRIYPYYNKCHGKCKTCNGPTEQNCLSCYDFQNREYYIGKNLCSCKFGYSEVANSFYCQDIFSQYYLEMKIEQPKQVCQININVNTIQVCSFCPEINYKCYDCLLNPNNWILNPICTKDIVFSSVISSSMLIQNRDLKDITLYTYHFDYGFQICEGCQELCSLNNQSCNQIKGRTHLNQQIFVKCKENFYFQDNSCQMCKSQCYRCVSLNECISCLDGYYLKDGNCFQCLKECSSCTINDQENIVCTACNQNYGLIQGTCQKCGSHCISCEESKHKVTNILFLRCLVCQDNQKYMISFDQYNCLSNQISNCKYGFIFSSQDRTINTLSLDQDFITQDTAIFGCALCEENYEYDIKNSLCQLKYAFICKQYIKDIDKANEQCLIFKNLQLPYNYFDSNLYVNDFECDRTQLQCTICLIAHLQNYCLLCKTGYYVDLNGACKQCPETLNCRNCFMQSKKYKDSWKLNVVTMFHYFNGLEIADFPLFKKLNTKPDDEYEILCNDCWENYELYNGLCIKACECFTCVKINNQNVCEISPYMSDFYSLTILDGKQIDCSTYCQFCFPLTQEQLKIINPYFSNQQYLHFSNKCLISNLKFNNLIYDSELLQYKRCVIFSNCQTEIAINYFLICQDNLNINKVESAKLITIEELFSQDNTSRFKDFENDLFYAYANSKLIEKIIINIQVQDSEKCFLPALSQLNHQFYKNIFSVKKVNLHIFSLQTTEFIVDQLYIQDFSFVQLENVQFKPNFKSFFLLYTDSLIIQQILFTNINFTNDKQENEFSIILNNVQFIEFKNVRFTDIQTSKNKSLIQINQAISSQLQFINVFLLNSVLSNAYFISLNKVTFSKIIIESLNIKTEFNDYPFINYQNSNQNDIIISKLQIMSTFRDCLSWLNFEDQNHVELNQLLIESSYLVNSKLIQLRENILVSNLNASENQLFDQSILLFFKNGYSLNTKYQLILENILFLENQCYNNYCLLYVLQDQDKSINQIAITKLFVFFNYRLTEQQDEIIDQYESLIILSLKYIIIEDLQFKRNFQPKIEDQIPINQIQINDVITLKITSILICDVNQQSVLLLYQLYTCSKSIEKQITNKPIIMIQSFQKLELNFIDISNVINFNSPIIKLQSQKSLLNQQEEQLFIQNINFTQNLLLATQYSYSKSILEISSDQKQNIELNNFNSQFNILHDYVQDYSIQSANLLLIESPLSSISMTNLNFKSNIVINSTNTQLLINCNTLQIVNSTFLNHNLMDQNIIYIIINKQNIDEFYIQYFEQVENYFPIISQSGIGQFHFRNLTIQSVMINHTLGYQGGVFSFYPKQDGFIQIIKSNFFNINSQFLLFETKGGCFYISLPSFKIDIQIQNCTFTNISTQHYGSIIYLESLIDHLVNLNIIDIYLQNIFSLQGSIIYMKQNRVDMNTISNYLLQNVQILQEENKFISYLAKFTLLSENQLNQFLEKRSLIDAIYSNISLNNFTVLDIFQEKILECSQCQQILIKNLFIHKGKNTLSLFSISSSQNSISVIFQNIQFLNLSNQINTFNDLNCNFKNSPLQLDTGCYTQQQSQELNIMNNLEYYYDDLYFKIVGQCNFNSIYKIITNQYSLIKISIQSNIQLIKFRNCQFSFISISNAIIKLNTKVFQSNNIQFKQISIQNNQCGYLGCIRLESNDSETNRLLQDQAQYEFEIVKYQIKIDQYFCFNNFAQNGVCLNIQNQAVQIIESLFINNTANQYGGSIYYTSNLTDQQLLFKFCQFYYNQAQIAGTIYSENIINSKWIKEYNFFENNRCIQFGNSIVIPPVKLGVTFNNYKTIYYPITIYESQSIKVDQIQFSKNPLINYFNLPSGCELNKYQTVTEDNLYINNQITFRLMGFDLNDEIMKNLLNSQCIIYDKIIDLQNKQTYFNKSELFQTAFNVKSIYFSNKTQDYNLDNIQLYVKTVNNVSSILQMVLYCPNIITQNLNSHYPYDIISTHNQYYLLININTLDCQLGEIQDQKTGACQQCDATQGFYSVVSQRQNNQFSEKLKYQQIHEQSFIFQKFKWILSLDQNFMKKVNYISLKKQLVQQYQIKIYVMQQTTQQLLKSNLPLLNYYRDIGDLIIIIENCDGGWNVGQNSCKNGYIGALCEQCDIYNIRGDGKYSNTETYQCGECQPDYQSALYAILLNLWNLFSLIFSVKSAQTSILNYVNKKNQIVVSTFLKIFINYFQLLFVVSTFQLPIPYQIIILLGFMGNPVRVISYSLDCALVDKIVIDIIYLRMIQQILYPFIYLFIMSSTYLIYTTYHKIQINFSYFYISISYLVLYYSPQILSSLINLMSQRSISNINWIQADVLQDELKFITLVFLKKSYENQRLHKNVIFLLKIFDILKINQIISYEYDTNKHYSWMYFLCIPLIFFLLFSISSLFVLLFNKRKKLKQNKSILYWGYLYLEYNTSSYFWEFVKLMLKILIAFVLIFLQERIFIKGCVCFLILSLYKSLITKFQPYKLRNINNIDQNASFICLLSILLGIMLRISYEIEINFFPQIIYVLLATINIIFTLYLLKLIFQSYLRQYSEKLDELKQFIKKTFPKLEKYKLCKKLLQNSSIVRNKAKQNLKRLTSSVISKSQLGNKSLITSKKRLQTIKESKSKQQFTEDQTKTSQQLYSRLDLRRVFFNNQTNKTNNEF